MAARRNLHLRGLQATHSSVLEIIEDTPHVAVYKFSPEERKWSRMDIEGSAYVTRNSESPFYSLIVLNKKGSEDLILQILQHIQKLLLQDQYLMMKCLIDSEEIVYGVWVHDDAERQIMFDSIQRIISKGSSTGQGDSMSSLLSKLTSVKVAMDGRSTIDSGNKQELTVIPQPSSSEVTIPVADKSLKLLSVLKKSAAPIEATVAPTVNTNLPPVPKTDSGSPTSTASSATASPPLAPSNGDMTVYSSPIATASKVIDAGFSSTVKSQKLLSILKSDTKGTVPPVNSIAVSANAPESTAAIPQPPVKIEPTSTKVTKKEQLLSLLSGGGNQTAGSIPVSNSNTVNVNITNSELLTDADIAKSLNKAKQIVVPSPPAMTNNAIPTAAITDTTTTTKVKPSVPVALSNNNTVGVASTKVPANNTTVQPSVVSNKFKIGSPVLTSMNSPVSSTSGAVNNSPAGIVTPKLPITASAKKPTVTLISPSDLENM